MYTTVQKFGVSLNGFERSHFWSPMLHLFDYKTIKAK